MTKEVAQEVTPTVEGKLIDMLDALQEGAVTVGDTVVKYAPDVADTALWVVRIDGISTLITCLLTLVLSILYIKNIRKFIKWDEDKTDGFIPFIASVFVGIGMVVSVLGLLSIWNWVAVFEPKLYLAKQVIESMTEVCK